MHRVWRAGTTAHGSGKVRRARTIVLCLLAGAAMNVAVAWACAWRFALVTGMTGTHAVWGADAAALGWPLTAPAGWSPPDAHEHARVLGVDGYHVMNTEGSASQSMWVVCAGLPLRSLVLNERRPAAPPRWERGMRFVSGGRYVRLPLVPLAAGFAANTAVYAIPLLASLPVAGWARRARRRRRGLCPACRYDLRHDLASGCPECGWGRAAS